MPADINSFKKLMLTKFKQYDEISINTILSYLTEFEAVMFIDNDQSTVSKQFKNKLNDNLDSITKKRYLLAQDILNNKRIKFIISKETHLSIEKVLAEAHQKKNIFCDRVVRRKK